MNDFELAYARSVIEQQQRISLYGLNEKTKQILQEMAQTKPFGSPSKTTHYIDGSLKFEQLDNDKGYVKRWWIFGKLQHEEMFQNGYGRRRGLHPNGRLAYVRYYQSSDSENPIEIVHESQFAEFDRHVITCLKNHQIDALIGGAA